MESWGFNPATLSAVGSIGLIVAMIAVFLGWLQNRRARNMDASLQIFFDFRDRWENKWGMSSGATLQTSILRRYTQEW